MNTAGVQAIQEMVNFTAMDGDCTPGEAFANVKADAFCEILGQEIDRVRNESMQKANEMREQYEMELQALRQEFNLR